MKVRAKEVGYYNNKRIKEGEVFELVPVKGFKVDALDRKSEISFTPEQQFSERWMEKLEGDEAAKAKPKHFGKKQESAASESVI